MKKNILILGGTLEARRLATALNDQYADRLTTLTSLAGVTRNPEPVAGDVRSGGFGGADGLAQFLKSEAIDLLIDATHPFAAQISQNAAQACESAHVARLYLARPNWTLPDRSDCVFVPDMSEAALLTARTARRAFLTIGRKELGAFSDIPDVHFVVRMIEAPAQPLNLVSYDLILGRPPFDLDAEVDLMRDYEIDTLVTKASGGDATFAKIEAAATVDARTILIRRPAPPDGDVVWGVDNAVGWVSDWIDQPA